MSVQVTGQIPDADKKRIERLFSTPMGSIPWDRSFGVDTSGIDGTPAAMEGALLVAYAQALLEWFPAYTIENLTFAVDCNKISPKVVITYA